MGRGSEFPIAFTAGSINPLFSLAIPRHKYNATLATSSPPALSSGRIPRGHRENIILFKGKIQ